MERLALLEGLDPGDLVDERLDLGGDAVIELGPFDCRPVPELVLGGSSRSDGQVDVGRRRHGDVDDVLARSRRADMVDVLAGAFGPLSCDVDPDGVDHGLLPFSRSVSPDWGCATR